MDQCRATLRRLALMMIHSGAALTEELYGRIRELSAQLNDYDAWRELSLGELVEAQICEDRESAEAYVEVQYFDLLLRTKEWRSLDCECVRENGSNWVSR